MHEMHDNHQNMESRADTDGRDTRARRHRAWHGVRSQLVGVLAASALTASVVGGVAVASHPVADEFSACAEDGKVIPGTISVDGDAQCTAPGWELVRWNATGPQG